MIKWGRIGGHVGVCLQLQFCHDLAPVFGITPPLYAEACIGGGIRVTLSRPCPQIALNIEGYAFFDFSIGLDFWICRINFASVKLEIAAGTGWMKDEICRQVRVKSSWHRRRVEVRCTVRMGCDVYIKGAITLTIAIARAQVGFIYWTKNKVLVITLKLFSWSFKWHEAYSCVLFRRWF